MGIWLNRWTSKGKVLPFILTLAVFFSMLQASQFALQKVDKASKGQYVLKSSKHVYLFEDYQQTKASLFESDKRKLLQAIQKATPDYLPIYGNLTGKNTYVLYAHQFILPNASLDKSVKDGKLTVTWQSAQAAWTALPVVKYTRTNLTLNGVKLAKGDYQLSEIGTVSLQAQKGHNELVISYQEPAFFSLTLWLTLLAWLGSMAVHFTKLTSKP